MRYYSEDTVKEILADYDEDVGGIFGELSDYDHIDLPEKHGRLIDEDSIGVKDEWALVETGRIWNAPTVLEANYRQVNSKQKICNLKRYLKVLVSFSKHQANRLQVTSK